jgi:hypothetical protein
MGHQSIPKNRVTQRILHSPFHLVVDFCLFGQMGVAPQQGRFQWNFPEKILLEKSGNEE